MAWGGASVLLVLALSFFFCGAGGALENFDLFQGKGNSPQFHWVDQEMGSHARRSESRSRSEGTYEQIARAALSSHLELYGITQLDVDEAQVHHVHDTGIGPVLVVFEQKANGLHVIRQKMVVSISRETLQPISFSGSLAHIPKGSDPQSQISLSPVQVVKAVVDDVTSRYIPVDSITLLDKKAGDYGFVRVAGVVEIPEEQEIRFKPVVYRNFPGYYLEVTVRNPVTIETKLWSYVISGLDGQLLSRHCLTHSSSFSFRAYANPSFPYAPLDSPRGNLFNPVKSRLTVLELQAAGYVDSSLITPTGILDQWLPEGANETSGNNVKAYADLVEPDGFSKGDMMGVVSSPGSFDWSYNPWLDPGSNATQTQAAITNVFYVFNWLHDWFYGAGFNEAAGNAQTSNYGRGGLENDPILVEVQDYSGTNNADMTTPDDGSSPKAQFYLFKGGTLSISFKLTSPVQITFDDVTPPNIGPSNFTLSGELIWVVDQEAPFDDGCSPITNDLKGKIALIRRGSCTFLQKATNAEVAGAIGVIILNNSPIPMGLGGDSDPKIGVIGLNKTTGDFLKDLLQKENKVVASMEVKKTVRYDSALENTVVIHEWAHYLSSRLVGILYNNQGGSMGEGWSDFVALLVSVGHLKNLEDLDGSWVMAQYVSPPVGFRRFPYSVNMTLNPTTFKHIADSTPFPIPSQINSEVHNSGEIWANMLWECFVGLVKTKAYSFEETRNRMKNYLVASLKMTPPAPTFTEARDGLLAAAFDSPNDYGAFCQAFAKRGMGQGAVSPPRSSADHEGVVESYYCGGYLVIQNMSLDDSIVSCDDDHILDQGESGNLKITIKNTTPSPVHNVTISMETTGIDEEILLFSKPGKNFTVTAKGGEVVTITIPVSLSSKALLGKRYSVCFWIPAQTAIQPNNFCTWLNWDLSPNSTTIDQVNGMQTNWENQALFPQIKEFNWRVTGDMSGEFFWYLDVSGGPPESILESAPMYVGNSKDLIFKFDQFYFFPMGTGGVIEIWSNWFTNWTDITQYSTTAANNGLSSLDGSGVLFGMMGYSGISADSFQLKKEAIYLRDFYQGHTIKFRFRYSANGFPGPQESAWVIDNLEVIGVMNKPFFEVDNQKCRIFNMTREPTVINMNFDELLA